MEPKRIPTPADWKNRYSHASDVPHNPQHDVASDEPYDVDVDWDDPAESAVHIIHGHAGNFDFTDQDKLDIVKACQTPEGRHEWNNIHAFLHRRGFMIDKQENSHNHQGIYHGEIPGWSRNIIDDDDD